MTCVRASPRRVGHFLSAPRRPHALATVAQQCGSLTGCIGCIGRAPMKDLKNVTSATSLSRSRPATSCGAVPVRRSFSHLLGRRRLLRYRGNGVSLRARGSASIPLGDPQRATRLHGSASTPTAQQDYFAVQPPCGAARMPGRRNIVHREPRWRSNGALYATDVPQEPTENSAKGMRGGGR